MHYMYASLTHLTAGSGAQVEVTVRTTLTLQPLDVRLALALASDVVALLVRNGAQLVAMAEVAAIRTKVVVGRNAHIASEPNEIRRACCKRVCPPLSVDAFAACTLAADFIACNA